MGCLGLLAALGVAAGCQPRSPARADAEAPDGASTPLAPIPGEALCVTAGRVDLRGGTSIHVDVGGMRGVIAGDVTRTAELAFTYRGPSRTTAALANGEIRRQIGLKLRAKDTCNVVYIMWHVDPTPGVFVSVKHNEGQSTHAECGARGYDNLASTRTLAPPPVHAGEPHTLRADLDGDTLRVRADGRVVWEQRLPAHAFSFDGPAGVRSDNGEFDFELRIPSGVRTGGTCTKGE